MGTLTLSNNPRAVTKDVHLDGFTLPKGTWIMPQMSALSSDDAFFPAAEQFNPGHHLDEQGRFRSRKEFIPFGIGKRLVKNFKNNVELQGGRP
jgi:cytochrome P450